MKLEKVYDELMAQIEDLKKAIAGGNSGVTSYDDLDNRPKVNNITLTGNKKSSDLKIAYSMTEAEYAAATKNAESIYCLQENATTFEEEDESASSSIEWSAGDPSGYVATWVYTPSNQNFTDCTVVECDDPAITIDGVSVVEGDVQVFLSCDDTTQIGETVTFTFTLTQPAGATRIVKDGIEMGEKSFLYEFGAGTGTTSREFSFSKVPKFVEIDWVSESNWYFSGSFIWGSPRLYYLAHNSSPSASYVTGGVATLTYSADKKTVTITAANAGAAANASDSSGSFYVHY